MRDADHAGLRSNKSDSLQRRPVHIPGCRAGWMDIERVSQVNTPETEDCLGIIYTALVVVVSTPKSPAWAHLRRGLALAVASDALLQVHAFGAMLDLCGRQPLSCLPEPRSPCDEYFGKSHAGQLDAERPEGHLESEASVQELLPCSEDMRFGEVNCTI